MKIIYIREGEAWKKAGECDTFKEGLDYLAMNYPGHFAEGNFSINVKGYVPSNPLAD